VRKENDPRETIDDVKGYGHTFPEAYTTWESDVKGSETHQRLVQYDFGELKCIVRFECDGYFGEEPDAQKRSVIKSNLQPGLDDVLRAFDNTKIKRGMPDLDGPLTIQTGGSSTPQHAIFDLKTRSSRFKREIDMSDIYPPLWLKQFPYFVLAYHDGFGTFHDIRVQDVKKDVQEWEKTNKAAIQRLAVLLNKIVEISREDDIGLLEVYSPTVDRLEIRRQHAEGVHALPLSLRSRWEGLDDGEVSNVGAGSDEGDRKEEEFLKVYDAFSDNSSDSSDDRDFTACSAHTCGYCGRCTY
jgi:hypothetical protein